MLEGPSYDGRLCHYLDRPSDEPGRNWSERVLDALMSERPKEIRAQAEIFQRHDNVSEDRRMSMTQSEILNALNKHCRDNYPRGGEWVAEGDSAVFVDGESRQPITAMRFQKAAWLVGGMTKPTTSEPNFDAENNA